MVRSGWWSCLCFASSATLAWTLVLYHDRDWLSLTNAVLSALGVLACLVILRRVRREDRSVR